MEVEAGRRSFSESHAGDACTRLGTDDRLCLNVLGNGLGYDWADNGWMLVCLTVIY
jgi:hypothetical protein